MFSETLLLFLGKDLGSCDKDHLGLGTGNNSGASFYAASGAAASLHGLYSAAAANSKSSIQSFYNCPRDSLHSLYNPTAHTPPAMSKHVSSLSSSSGSTSSGEMASICSTLLPRAANAGNSVGSRGLTTSSASSSSNMSMLYSSLPVVSGGSSAGDLYSTSLGISTSGGSASGNPLAGAFRNQFLASGDSGGSNPGSPVGLSHSSHHPQHTSHSLSTTSASTFPPPPPAAGGCSPPPTASNLFSSLPHPLAPPPTSSTSKESGLLSPPPHLSMQHPNLPCSLSSTLPFNFRQHYSYLQSSYSSSANH